MKTKQTYLEPNQIGRALTAEEVNNLDTNVIDPLIALENQIMKNWDDPSNLVSSL